MLHQFSIEMRHPIDFILFCFSSLHIFIFVPLQVREADKDPVYKYLESMMTCARVREFNSKPPPEVTLEPKVLHSSTPNASVKAEETAAESLPKMYYRTLQNHKAAGKESKPALQSACTVSPANERSGFPAPLSSRFGDIDICASFCPPAENVPLGISSEERAARKQIEIQSLCPWKTDRKRVLEALLRRLKHDRLSKRFYIGPYRIRPVAKIFMKKPSGSLVTYRVGLMGV